MVVTSLTLHDAAQELVFPAQHHSHQKSCCCRPLTGGTFRKVKVQILGTFPFAHKARCHCSIMELCLWRPHGEQLADSLRETKVSSYNVTFSFCANSDKIAVGSLLYWSVVYTGLSYWSVVLVCRTGLSYWSVKKAGTVLNKQLISLNSLVGHALQDHNL